MSQINIDYMLEQYPDPNAALIWHLNEKRRRLIEAELGDGIATAYGPKERLLTSKVKEPTRSEEMHHDHAGKC
jgi:hypothetical protein